MKGLRGLLAGLALPLLAAAASGGSLADDAATLNESGKALLGKNCSRCHAIGRTDTSTHAEAPAFRDVMKRYPAEDLAEALAEGIVSGHPDMPEFAFEPGEVDAIVSYLDSLRDDDAK